MNEQTEQETPEGEKPSTIPPSAGAETEGATPKTLEDALLELGVLRARVRQLEEGKKNANQDDAKRRRENQSLRDDLAKLTEKLGEAKAEVADLKSQMQESERRRMRISAASKAGFSGDDAETVAERLVGDTEDELGEDAKKLLTLMGKRTQVSNDAGRRGNAPTKTPEDIVKEKQASGRYAKA